MKTGKLRVALPIGLVLVAGCAAPRQAADPQTAGSATQPRLDVIWVPTDVRLVTTMLDAARVGPGDVVYDLGCGDGRIVIAAAARYGARGVGVDLDPARIREARENAARAGVTDRVTFLVQDLFATDVSPATVVALYLGADVNLRLRPKLLRELRPGTRLVSHEFDMGDWLPERTLEVSMVERNHRVFLWTIPDPAAPHPSR
ncbi:MAG: SAM-dependent methyltransferase [Candidatus Rokuibacteriota bacterium]